MPVYALTARPPDSVTVAERMPLNAAGGRTSSGMAKENLCRPCSSNRASPSWMSIFLKVRSVSPNVYDWYFGALKGRASSSTCASTLRPAAGGPNKFFAITSTEAVSPVRYDVLSGVIVTLMRSGTNSSTLKEALPIS